MKENFWPRVLDLVLLWAGLMNLSPTSCWGERWMPLTGTAQKKPILKLPGCRGLLKFPWQLKPWRNQAGMMWLYAWGP
jgi:hypothetical protein